MEQLRGYVSQIIYRNPENTYTVFELTSEGDTITCTGFPAVINEGESCELTGEYIEHPVYGEQLKISSYRPCAPEDAEAVYRYLSSGAIKGIGEKLAARIIRKFGDDTMQILDEQPERLAEVKGISESAARRIAAQVEEKREVRQALLFLSQFGISNRQALKIWETYGMEMYRILKENPYRLAEDINGIGFARADEIAAMAGVNPDSDFRIRSGILYAMSETLHEGSCWLPKPMALAKACALLNLPEEVVEIQMNNLAVERRLILTGTDPVQVYSAHAYYLEQQIARLLTDLNNAGTRRYSDSEILKRIRTIEEREDIVLDDLQREAVLLAATSPVLILSGGPGTGKTTTINMIIRYHISDVKAVVLAAPTGRAAKRMTETTGYEAMTIHRLLGYKMTGQEDAFGDSREDESFRFERDQDNPLEADVVIVDETSMVDIFLFCALLKALKPGTRLILSGDADQLPSVGPGRVLQDLMESEAFSCVVLQKIFRQASQSDIVMNAHAILKGEPMRLDNKSRDFFFLERNDAGVIYKHTVQMLRDMLPKYLSCRPEEIQVLTPTRKGALGSLALNEVLQSVLNPPAPDKGEYAAHDVVFRVGDKVMQTRNNYQIPWAVEGNFGIAVDSGTGIFNGDFGRILRIDEDLQTMTILFDDERTVEYPFRSLDDLELAYAITVHKSQGSEYPAVILPLLGGPQNLFNRNLLYTAVTRARKAVVILGSRRVLETMAANTRQSMRYTGLRDRLIEMQKG